MLKIVKIRNILYSPKGYFYDRDCIRCDLNNETCQAFNYPCFQCCGYFRKINLVEIDEKSRKLVSLQREKSKKIITLSSSQITRK